MVKWEKSKVKLKLNFFSIMKDLIIVSDNPGKIREYQDKLKDIRCLPYKDVVNVGDIPETAHTFKDNAYLKAMTIFRITNRPCLADDSGLIVEALPNELGVHSKRFSKAMTAKANNQLLLEKLKDKSNRKAHFHTSICLLVPGQAPRFYEGNLYGRILKEPRGKGGFGYDPLFQVENDHRTLAEMSLEEKNQISHRAKAMQALLEDIQDVDFDFF